MSTLTTTNITGTRADINSDADSPSSFNDINNSNQSDIYHVLDKDTSHEETVADEKDTWSDEEDTWSNEDTSSDENRFAVHQRGGLENEDEDEDQDKDKEDLPVSNVDVNKQTRYKELEANVFCHLKVKAMREELLNGYEVPTDPPQLPPTCHILTRSQELSLEYFVAWSKSKGTVKAYISHATALEKATEIKILSLPLAKWLAAKLTDLKPT